MAILQDYIAQSKQLFHIVASNTLLYYTAATCPNKGTADFHSESLSRCESYRMLPPDTKQSLFLELEHKQQNNEDDGGCSHDKNAHHFVVLLLECICLLKLLKPLLDPSLNIVKIVVYPIQHCTLLKENKTVSNPSKFYLPNTKFISIYFVTY